MVKILIVDDELDFCDYLSRILCREGYTTITANCGKEAIEKVKTERPHLVLLDFLMPEMDGIETLKKIKEVDKDAVVIVVTAVNDIEVAKRAIRHGAVNYVTKPVDLYLLKRNLKNWSVWKEANELCDMDIIALDYDEKSFATILNLFTSKGYRIKNIADKNMPLSIDGPLDLLILRADIMGERTIEILSKYKEAYPGLKVMVTLNPDTGNGLMSKIEKLGACHCLPSSFGIYGLILIIHKMLAKSKEKRSFEESRKLADYIFIVDDEPDVCEYIGKYLSREGYKVYSFTNPREVLEHVKTLKPSIVLLDIVMPQVDGLELLKKIKIINPKIQVIMMTGVRDEAVWKESVEAGAVDYLIKPFSLDQLKATIFTNSIKFHMG